MTAAKGALDYFTHQSRKQSYLLKSYQELFFKEPQLKKIIQALYQAQGNTTLAVPRSYIYIAIRYSIN